jgi:hypothetical protein
MINIEAALSRFLADSCPSFVGGHEDAACSFFHFVTASYIVLAAEKAGFF